MPQKSVGFYMSIFNKKLILTADCQQHINENNLDN